MLLSLLVLAAAIAAGCGGPDNPKKALAEACERQIAEVKEASHGGDTREAKSTKEFVDNEQLVECAGQPALIAGMKPADDKGDAAGDAGGDKPAGEEPAPALDEATIAAEREKFTTSCASCHVLSDAGATGSFGPDLDDSKMTVDEMTAQIENGGGGMPGGLLTGDDAASMSAYIESVRGS